MGWSGRRDGLIGMAQDVRLALRLLAATPIVTGAAVLSLALSMGANTAVFSVVNALVLRPLPVKDADRLAIVSSGSTVPNLQQYSYSTNGSTAPSASSASSPRRCMRWAMK